MTQDVDEVAALRASLQAEEQVARVHLNSYLIEKVRVDALLDALRRLLTFNEELCQDVGVSTHYPSADFARALIAQAKYWRSECEGGRTKL